MEFRMGVRPTHSDENRSNLTIAGLNHLFVLRLSGSPEGDRFMHA